MPLRTQTMQTPSIPYGPGFPENTNRFNHLHKTRTHLQVKLQKNVQLALKLCDPKKEIFSSDTSCAVLWDNIEEYSSKIDSIDNSLTAFWECWDETECRIYDI